VKDIAFWDNPFRFLCSNHDVEYWGTGITPVFFCPIFELRRKRIRKQLKRNEVKGKDKIPRSDRLHWINWLLIAAGIVFFLWALLFCGEKELRWIVSLGQKK
jgi:hypothetical protein